MNRIRLIALASITMTGFASNSLLCRIALTATSIDASSFTIVRIISAAVALQIVVRIKGISNGSTGSWASALALFVYAAAFSFAYVGLTAATGALLLFMAVQVTMTGHGIWAGERLNKWKIIGLILAWSGFICLLLPGLSAPPIDSALLMVGAGTAWGIYSIRGKRIGDPVAVTAGNFLRAVPVSVLLSVLTFRNGVLDVKGIGIGIISGAIASGMVYVIWYWILPELKPTSAATIQLSVPVIAALGGIFILDEPLTIQFIVSSLATLSGIYLTIHGSGIGIDHPHGFPLTPQKPKHKYKA